MTTIPPMPGDWLERCARGHERWMAEQIPAVGTQRRINALRAAGFTLRQLSAVTGVATSTLQTISVGDRRFVLPATAAALAEHYPALIDKPPDSSAGHLYRNGYDAAAKGWLGPERWDSARLDDADAEPYPCGEITPDEVSETVVDDICAGRDSFGAGTHAEQVAAVTVLVRAGLSQTEIVRRVRASHRTVRARMIEAGLGEIIGRSVGGELSA